MPDGANLYRPDSPQKSPAKKLTPPSHLPISNGAGNGNGSVSGGEESPRRRAPQQDEVSDSEDEGLVDYNDVGPMSPIKRMGTIVPETIPE